MGDCGCAARRIVVQIVRAQACVPRAAAADRMRLLPIANRLQAINAWRISAVTYIDLAQGCRDKTELAQLNKGLAARHTEIVPITPAISARAAQLIDSHALSHGLRLADALIGAAAIEHQSTLITANLRHFPAVDRLTIEAFEP